MQYGFQRIQKGLYSPVGGLNGFKRQGMDQRKKPRRPVDYLLVGGGAGGADLGGQGGQVVPGTASLNVGSLPVVVGTRGGAGIGDASIPANPGGASSFNGIAAPGGPNANVSGAGANGPASSISGVSVIYGSSGGGNGGANSGGSGAGNGSGTGDGTSGAPNRGGGGGGGALSPLSTGGDGGSGVVIIRYLTGAYVATGGTITTPAGFTIHTFTASGTFTVTA